MCSSQVSHLGKEGSNIKSGNGGRKLGVLGSVVVKDKSKKLALGVGKQQLIALTARLWRYSKDADNKRISQLFGLNPHGCTPSFGMIQGFNSCAQGGDWEVLGGHLGHRRHAQCIC